mgnify:CR=1 FL=1
MDASVTLRNLGGISALAENDKINTREDYFSIYYPTTWRGLARFAYYNEGREHNIEKINQCIQNAKGYITTCLNEIVNEPSDNHTETNNNFLRKLSLNGKSQTCCRMIHLLESSKKGVESLKITYKDDAASKSKLECLLYEIEDFLTTTRSLAVSSNLTLLK